MRRIDKILVVVVFLLGAGVAYAIMDSIQNKREKAELKQEIETIKQDNLRLSNEVNNTITTDSLTSILENKIMESQDSLIKIYEEKLNNAKRYYRYELQKRDNVIQARLDSISDVMPVLPDF